jgi:dipeptidase E
MKLLLTSQGIPSELKDTFLSLLSKPPMEIRVSFITTAALSEGEIKPEWLEYYKKQLNGYGINQIEELDIRNKNELELQHIIEDKDIIFVNGGNTFFLLYWVRKTGFDKVILKHVNRGKLYIGISAGSYIACPTIEQSYWKNADKNKIGLKNLTALNLVPFLITAHFEEKYRQIIENAAKTAKYPIIALNDTQAIMVTDNKWRVVGRGNKEYFNGFKVI